VPTRVICISHTAGSEGQTIGQAVSERLGFRYLDEEIIESAAESMSVDPEVISNAERRKSLAARFLDQLGKRTTAQSYPRLQTSAGPASAGEAATREVPSIEDVRALIREVIHEAADEGDVVIVAHAASMALGGRDDVLRVLVTASPETRAKRVGDARRLDARSASKQVRDEDAARADYLKRFYGVDREIPTHYDLVVNTDVVGVDRARDLVALAAA
jgi:cytidylate kinase